MISDISTLAAGVDRAFFFIVFVSVILLVLITFLMVYFVIRYSRAKNKKPQDIEGNIFLEVVWIVVPTILVLGMFYFGWVGFKSMREFPEDAMPVKVEAWMWDWSFEYENGKKSDILRIPVGRKVMLTMTSRDMIHSLFIPAFRVKEDVVPGQVTKMWFVSNREGTYDAFCAEYCGTGHSAMGTKVIVMPEEDFEKWYTAEKDEDWALLDGPTLLQKHGCMSCHSTDGSKRLGPSFKGAFGAEREVKTRGKDRRIIVDEAYLKKSILEPDYDVLKGYQALMPSMEGILNEKEMNVMVKYLTRIGQ